MTKQTIDIGAVADDGTGDPIRTAFDKANDNFDELYLLLPNVQTATPTNGATVAISNSTSREIKLFLQHLSTIASATIEMPSAPADGQRVSIRSRSAITATTFSATGGKSLIGNTNLPAAGHASWEYLDADSLWYRAE
jgi:hypothetical protein